MLFFLNPFTWGMRKVEYYQFPEKFWEATDTIQKDIIFYGGGDFFKRPTKQDVKDCERGHKKLNLIFNLGEAVDKKLPTKFLNDRIDTYAEEILTTLPKKMCFDSLIFTYFHKVYNHDSLTAKDYEIYKKRSYKRNN
jgi:hypothetical protein